MAQDFAQYDPKLGMAPVEPPANEPQAIVTSVTPPAAGQVSGVTNVNLDYDPNFKKIVDGIALNTPEGRKGAADAFTLKINEDKAAQNYNKQTQVVPMIISLLSGKLMDAYKFYNGGFTHEEQGKDALGNWYVVEKNQLGNTGVYKDWNTGKTLTENEVKALQIRGGVLTQSDKDAAMTGNWKTVQDAQAQAATNMNSQLNATRTKAQVAANMGGATNRNIDEEVDLAIKNKHVIDYIGKLDAKQRQQLLGFTSRFLNNSASLSREDQKKGSTGVSTQGQFGGGFGLSIGAAGSVGSSQANAESIGRSNTIQDQQNLQSAIMKQLQGVISKDTEFYDFMRLVSLNDLNNRALSEVPDEAKPKGFQDASAVDLFTGGMDSLLKNRYVQQGNNALIAEYNKELYRSQRDAIREGKISDPLEVQDRLMQSDYYKGVENFVKQKLGILKGENPLKKGDPIFDKTTGKIKRVE